MTRRERAHAEPDATIMGKAAPRLRALSRLNEYAIADGDADIRSWTVFDTGGYGVGTVHDLLIDISTLEARYIDLEVWKGLAGSEDRHVLIPIGMARLSHDVEALTLPNVDAAWLAALPPFDHGVFTRARECELLGAVMGSARASDDLGPAFYGQPHFDCSRFWGRRATDRTRAYAVVLRSDLDDG